MNAVLAAWEHHRRMQQGWTRAAIRAQGIHVSDAQEGLIAADTRLRGQADVMFRPGTGSLSIEGQEPNVEEGSPVQPELLILAGIGRDYVFGCCAGVSFHNGELASKH